MEELRHYQKIRNPVINHFTVYLGVFEAQFDHHIRMINKTQNGLVHDQWFEAYAKLCKNF